MVSTRSQLVLRARHSSKSRRFVMKTNLGTFVVDQSIAFREVYVMRAEDVDLAQPRLLTPGRHSGNGIIQRSPLSLRRLNSIHATQTIHRIVITNATTGHRSQFVFGVRRVRSKNCEQCWSLGRSVTHRCFAKEDVKFLL